MARLTWVSLISGLAGASVAGAQQSGVAAGSKECRSRGGERAGERNAAPVEMQCSGAACNVLLDRGHGGVHL